MKYKMMLLGETIVDIMISLFECIEEFWNEASDKCKAYTIGAFILLLIFVGIDIYEYRLNSKAEAEIQNTANAVFDPCIQEIENMDTQTQDIIQPFKDMVIELKPQWIKLATLAASLIIGMVVKMIKTPVEGIKNIMSNFLDEVMEEAEMWLPFMILAVIDIMEIILSFS